MIAYVLTCESYVFPVGYYGEAIGSIQPPWHACFAAPLLDSRLPCSVCPKEGCIHMEFCWSAPTLPSAALHNVLELQNGF